MNRPLTIVFSALEALLVVGIGIGITLVPLTVMWAFQYGLQVDWIVFWRVAVDIWLLGHGADMRVTLDAATAASVGFAEAANPFILTIAPLGFALLTLLLGQRAGRRIAETPHYFLGITVALATFGVLALGATLSTLNDLARVSIWQGTVLPTVVFAIGLAIGAGLAIDRLGYRERTATTRTDVAVAGIRSRLTALPQHVSTVLRSALRGGAAAVAAIIAVAAVLVAVRLATNYAEIIAHYQGAHAGVLGGIALTVAQLAFVPNLVIWAAAWLIGPGFAIGVGSAVTPLGTSLGPLPGVPFLGALPTGELAWGFLGLLIPVVAGFFAGVVVRPRLLRALGGRSPLRWSLITGVGIGVAAGILLGLLAWFSAGAAGPGRLVEVGPVPWAVGLFAFLQIGVAAVLGLLAGRPARD